MHFTSTILILLSLLPSYFIADLTAFCPIVKALSSSSSLLIISLGEPLAAITFKGVISGNLS